MSTPQTDTPLPDWLPELIPFQGDWNAFVRALHVVFAQVFHVRTDGDDASNGLSWATAKRTLEAAVAAAGGAGTIYLAAGAYTLTNTVVLSVPVRIIGTNGTPVIDGSLKSYRAFTLNHDDASVKNLWLANFNNSSSGATLWLTQGTVDSCVISNGNTRGNGTNAGGIYAAGGMITNCTFTRCRSDVSRGYTYGPALFLKSGHVTDCRFVSNFGSGSSHSGAAYLEGGVLEKCVFTQHERTPIENNGATVRNCLVYGNTCSVKPGYDTITWLAGVWQTQGNLYNCTIVGNSHSGPVIGCAGLKATGGAVKNCIVWNNPSCDGTAAGFSFASSVAAHTNLLDSASSVGIGNMSSDPMFRNPATNDYRLVLASPAIGTAASIDGVTADLNGVARPQGGAPEIGCHEYVSDATNLMAGIRIPAQTLGPFVPATFIAVVDGPDLAGLSYTWWLDGTVVAEGPDKAEFSRPSFAIGMHDLKLVVTNGVGKTATDEKLNAFTVYPSEVYVSETGSSAFPYTNWTTAATNVSEAFACLWKAANMTSVVHIAQGRYPVASEIILNTPFRLSGAGVGKTVLVGPVTEIRCFALLHADVEVSDVKVTGFTSRVKTGAGALVERGLLHDCRFEGCRVRMENGSKGGGIHQAGGIVRDCIVTNCSIVQTRGYADGNGVYISAGLMERCRILDCYNGQDGLGLGVEAVGGTVRDCVISGNRSTTYYDDAALHVNGSGALIENCVVTGNVAGVKLAAGTVRNCLVAGNGLARDKTIVRVSGGTFLNCTVAGNGTGAAVGLSQSAGKVANNIIWGNATTGAAVTGGTFATNLVDAAVDYASQAGTIVSATSPFKRIERGDCHLGSGSPAARAGDASFWSGVADPADLDGNPRLTPSGKVDLGCYQLQAIGLIIIVR